MTPQFCLPAAGEAAPHHPTPAGKQGNTRPSPGRPRRRGSRGEPSIASLPGSSSRGEQRTAATAPRAGRRHTSGGARSRGSVLPGDSPPPPPAALRGPAARTASPAPASLLTSVPAHAQARPAARPPPHIAAGRGGPAPVTARSQWRRRLSRPPCAGPEGGAAGRLP